MKEIFDKEQYFFDSATIKRLQQFLANTNFKYICILGAPFLADKLNENCYKLTILDIEMWFFYLENFFIL